jgi:predicted MFS family arabinose efflux permease
MNGVPILKLYRDAFRGLSSGSWLLGATLLINRSGTMVVPFMSLYLTQSLHFDITYAGYAMMCFGAGSVLGGFLGGRLAGKLGFYPVMLGSLVSSGLLFILLGFIRNFPMFCTVSFILAVMADAFRPATGMAVAAYSTPENRTRSYSVQRLAVNLGWGTGMALGGWLASISYRLIFWADGITSLVAAVFILFFLKKPADGGKQSDPPRHEKGDGLTAWRDKVYLFFIFLSIVFGICFFQSSATLPLFYKEVVKLDEHQFGWIMSMNGLMIAVMEMVLVYSLEGRRNSLTYIKAGVVLLALAFAALIGLPHLLWVMVFSMVLMTFGEMMSMPFMNSFWIGRSKDHNRGDYAGLYTMSWSIAQITAPLLGTQVVKHLGFDALWWTCIGMCLLIFVGFLYLRKKVSAF